MAVKGGYERLRGQNEQVVQFYAGEVTANSSISYTSYMRMYIYNLYELLPNLSGALIALNRQQSLLVTHLKAVCHSWE